MEPSIFVLILSELRLLSFIFSFLMRVWLCIRACRSKKVVVDHAARFIFSSDLVFLSTTAVKLIFDNGRLLDILLAGLFSIVVTKMTELFIKVEQHHNQLQSMERSAEHLKELSEQLALDNNRLLEENKDLGFEVGTKTVQVNAAEANATIVKKQYMDLILDYDLLLEENKNLKNQLDSWEIVTTTDTD